MLVKEVIPNLNKKVRYKDSVSCVLNGCAIRKRANGEIFYLAELLDKNKNCVYIVSLDEIEKVSVDG